MATFDPRRLLMFAVRVLKPHSENRSLWLMLVSIQVRRENNSRNARKAGVGIRDLLREKQAVAGDGLSGIVMWHGESSRDPQARE